MMPLLPSRAQQILDEMRHRRLLVVGDVMLDEWIWGTVTRISPEAPVPVVAVTDHSFTLGGAGNVANNLRALDADVDFVAATGADSFANHIACLLADQLISPDGLIRVEDRPTTRKTRVVAHSQQVVRADWEISAPLSVADRARIASAVRGYATAADAVVLSDYAKGILCRDIVEAALSCSLVLADPKPENLRYFSGVTCIAPNVHEAAQATGIAIVDEASVERAGRALLETLDCRYVIITRGEQGMSLFHHDAAPMHIASVARTVFDVSGAGDTVIAVLSQALAAGAPIEEALQLANYAAGAVVEKLGTATVSGSEILTLIKDAAASSAAPLSLSVGGHS